MMGHREKMKNGGEMDAVWKGCRRLYDPPAGVRRYWKQKLSRRARREAKQQA